MDEARLIEKLMRIEALYAGATTPGERVAAGRARDRIIERLRATEVLDPPIEYRFTLADPWSRRVFLALLRRYDIRPYRYPRQRSTTLMARVSRRFVDETLWPEFQQLSETLRVWLAEVTDRVIAEVLHGDSSEAEVVDEPPQLDLVLGAAAANAPQPPPPPPPPKSPAHPQPDIIEPPAAPRQGTDKRKKVKRKRR